MNSQYKEHNSDYAIEKYLLSSGYLYGNSELFENALALYPIIIERIQLMLTDEDIANIAGAYHARREKPDTGEYLDILGFCKSATSDKIRDHGHIITPGCDVCQMNEKPSETPTIEELSAYLKIPKSMLFKRVWENKIHSHKLGHHWRLQRGAIDQWLEEMGSYIPLSEDSL